jgi:lysozyme family protein
MANDFESILKETLLIEGGYSFDPSDNGGETLFGIARVKNPGWAGWKEVDSIIRNKGYDKHNRDNWPLIANACKDINSIFDFYRINFWNTIKGSEIGSYAVAKTIFDFGVNTGVGTSVKCVQRVLGIVDDGDFGYLDSVMSRVKVFVMFYCNVIRFSIFDFVRYFACWAYK